MALGDLAANKSGYELTYKAQLTDAAKKLLAAGEKLDDAQNVANWTWDGADKPGEADTTPNFSYKMVQKSKGSGNASDIKWTVKLNTGSIKADMANYVFKDELQGGQHYIGSYTVKNAKGKVVATGELDGSASSFNYTFPADAGAQQYTIEYHTALDDADSTATVNNHAEVTPPDDQHPGGSDDGSYTPKGPDQPDDTNTYVTKSVDSSKASTDGTAEWTSLVKFSLMAANTDPTSVQFIDEKLEFDQTANTSGSSDGGFGFDLNREPVLTIDGTTLTNGVDYSLKYADDSIKITFKSSAAIKAAIGKSDVQIQYWTVSDKTPGKYKNTAKVKYDRDTTSATADYSIENTNLVYKTGKMVWNKDFDWSQIDANDTTKGAWIATWNVTVNENDDQNDGAGKEELNGKPIVVIDTLPEGMSYVPGGTYTVQAGYNPLATNTSNGAIKGKLDDVLENNAGKLTFTIPTEGVVQRDGSDKAFAKLTYQTAAKGTGQEVNFTNTAMADSGSIHFGEDSDTVTGSSKVITKSAAQVKDLNRVRYTIKVNPEGADLIKDSDTVTLSDVMDAEGTFIPASLKITNSNTGATLMVPVKVEDVTDADGNPTTKLTLTLPDSTPVTVVYDVKPNGTPGEKVNLKNTATLDGVAGGESINDKDWNVTKPTSGTDGAAGTIAITKADSADLSRYLSGAEFALYKVDMSKLSGSKVTFDQVQKASAQASSNITTDASGHAQFGTTNQPLETNTLFYFVETKAPTFTADDGTVTEYKLDSTPHYFMLPGTNADEAAAALAKAKSFGLPVSDSTSFNVYDTRKPASIKGSVTLGKQLTGRTWSDADAFTFKLAPNTKNSKNVTEDELNAAMPKNTTATAKKTGDGADGSISTFTFGDFTFAEPGTYAYTVKETSKGGDGVTVDTRTANVTFTVVQNAAGNLEIKNDQADVSGITENHGNWTFENTYKPTEITVSNAIKVKKTLEGRQWRDGDSFEFRLQPATPTEDAPLPSDAADGYAKLTVTDANEHAFGKITYTKAGEYHYSVFEHTPTDGSKQALPGVDYSNALYNVTVTIKDDGKGKLTNGGVTMTKAQNDDGSDAGDAAVVNNVAAVTNTFQAEEANLGLLVAKTYTDKTGTNPLTDGKFSFTLTAQNGAPLPENTVGDSVVANVTKAGVASFPEIKFTSARDDGKTYTYTLKENVPDGAVVSADGTTATLNGMTYDLTTYMVQVPVAMTTDQDGKQVLGYSVKVLDANGNEVDASKLRSGRPVFSNTYNLAPVDVNIAGQKTLTGRDMDANEQFLFRLAAAEDDTAEAKAARAGLKDDSIIFGENKSADKMETTVTGAKADQPAAFDFNGIHFTKPGTFKFAVTEVGEVKNGTTKDDHVAYVTVEVKDNGDGTLAATATYDNSAAKTDSDKAATDKSTFTNTYAPTGYAFFLLHKKLTAADGVAAPKLTAGAFSFGLYQGDGTTGAKIQTKKNAAPTVGETAGHVTFDRITYTPAALAQAVADKYATYNAATKTWHLTYTVAELGDDGQPVTAGYAKDGIAYDATTRKIEVTVTDTGTGTLQTSYTVSDGDPNTSDDANSDEAAFANVYTPASATANLYAQKVLDGREWNTDGSDSFDFKLEAVSGKFTANKADVAKADIPMPEGSANGELTKTVINGDEFSFGNITYTKAGTYVYNISEVTPENPLPGVSYSTDLYRATVTVKDNGKGQLNSEVAMELVSKADPNAKESKSVVAQAQNGDPLAQITNTYAKLSQNWSLKVYKNYADNSGENPLTAGKFQFKLTPVDGAPLHVLTADGSVKDATSLTAETAANAEGAFKDVQFTDADLAENGAAKTYTYEVSEVKGSEPGMTYDTTVYTVKVTVAVDADGYLTVTPVITDKDGQRVDASKLNAGRPVFANTYTPAATEAQIKAHKTLDGATLKANQFSFNLYEGQKFGATTDQPLQTKANDENGDVTFDKITYSKTGTYTYSINEVIPDDAVDDMKNGITYDHTWQYVQVVVALDKSTGKLNATVKDLNTDSDTAQFTNTYSANGAVSLKAKKEFKNSDGSARTIPTNTFKFQLHEGATVNGKVLQTKTAAADGSVNFDSIAYKLSDLVGAKSKTFTYTVNEVVPEAAKDRLAGVTYSTDAYTYTVTVTNNGTGKLTTSTKVGDKTGVTPTFTNTYDAVGQTAIAGTKKVTGDDGSNQTASFANAFTFTLTGNDGAPLHISDAAGELQNKSELTATNTADGTVSFGSLHYTLADLKDAAVDAHGTRSKTFTYEVTESGTADGVTNDAAATKSFTVTVADNGTGVLSVTTEPADAAQLFSFDNTYAASAELTLNGTKKLTGRALTENDKFTFNVYEGTNTTGTPVATGTNDASGKIVFDQPLRYTLANLGNHTYTVVESEDGLPGGVSAVTRTSTFTVNVEDKDHNGKLTLTTNGLDSNTGLTFENNYTTTDSTPIEFKGVKLLDDGDYSTTLGQLKGKFTFMLTGVDAEDSAKAAPLPSKTEATNDEAGNVNFGKVTYTFADLNDQTERKFTYTVTESGKVAGVTNDANLTRTFTVTIKDNGDGTMSATTDPASGALFDFTNTYSAGKVTDAFTFAKTLDGRALNDGEFTFTLTGGTDSDGVAVPMPEGTKDGVATATNDADSKIAFGDITYSKPGMYAYTVREGAGKLGGVTYDDTVYTVTVTVVDNHDGTMTATHQIVRTAPTVGDADGNAATEQYVSTPVEDKDAVFANSYAPAPTEFTFTATKTLKGRDLKDGEFTFELRDASGKTLQQVKNAANGKISFAPITFEKAGEYQYTISEVAGNAQGIAYDSTVYTAKITVVDNLDGTMTATAAYSSGVLGLNHEAPAFENTYTPPLSDTGSNTASIAALALIMLGGGLMLVAIRRKRESEAVLVAASAARGKHRK